MKTPYLTNGKVRRKKWAVACARDYQITHAQVNRLRDWPIAQKIDQYCVLYSGWLRGSRQDPPTHEVTTFSL